MWNLVSMVLLGDEAQVDACFGLFGDSANLDARLMHGLRRTYYRLRNRFERTRWISYVILVMWNLISIHFGTVVVLVQDRRTVCAKRTIGTEIILYAPDGTPR
jgi:hypothetical protein